MFHNSGCPRNWRLEGTNELSALLHSKNGKKSNKKTQTHMIRTIHIYPQTSKQTSKQTNKQTTNKQTNKQTNKHTDTHPTHTGNEHPEKWTTLSNHANEKTLGK
jgi:hypothetical protein